MRNPMCHAAAGLLITGALLTAQLSHVTDSSVASTPVWQTLQPAQWTEADAQQVLTHSPWARQIIAGVARRLTEEQLREGGQMGQPQTVGNAGIDKPGTGPKVDLNIFTGKGGDDRSIRSRPGMIALRLTWESALPIRLAELKSHVVEPPTLEGDGYEIAVYGIPGPAFKQDPEQLGAPLKETATLRRPGKKDAKPIRAEVFQRSDGIAVVYLFSLSAEIGKRDSEVQFHAQIGRIVIAHTFELKDMEFQGRLEL